MQIYKYIFWKRQRKNIFKLVQPKKGWHIDHFVILNYVYKVFRTLM